MRESAPQVYDSKSSRRGHKVLSCVVVGLLAFTAHPAAVQDAPPGAVLRPWEPPDANRIPDKNDQLQMQQQQQQRKQTDYAAANLERKRQIAEDAAKLLELATDLKKEVDKTDKDTLSINIMKKAETIERLAKGVREKMKLIAGQHA